MATYENGKGLDGSGEPLNQNYGEQEKDDGTMLGKSDITEDNETYMEFYEDLPNSGQPSASVPHKTIGGVQYAMVDAKSQVAVLKQGGGNGKESGQAKSSSPGTLPLFKCL